MDLFRMVGKLEDGSTLFDDAITDTTDPLVVATRHVEMSERAVRDGHTVTVQMFDGVTGELDMTNVLDSSTLFVEANSAFGSEFGKRMGLREGFTDVQ